MKTFLKNKKGFTLTELMIVVVILGILVLIAVPIYNNATDKAERSTCAANRRTIESAMVQYNVIEEGGLSDNIDIEGPDGLEGLLGGTYIDEWPECPSGGTYGLSESGVNITCTIHGD